MEKRKTGIKNIAPYAYITPITLILVTFVIGSVIISVVLGFTKYNIMTEPVFRGWIIIEGCLQTASLLRR